MIKQENVPETTAVLFSSVFNRSKKSSQNSQFWDPHHIVIICYRRNHFKLLCLYSIWFNEFSLQVTKEHCSYSFFHMHHFILLPEAECNIIFPNLLWLSWMDFPSFHFQTPTSFHIIINPRSEMCNKFSSKSYLHWSN